MAGAMAVVVASAAMIAGRIAPRSNSRPRSRLRAPNGANGKSRAARNVVKIGGKIAARMAAVRMAAATTGAAGADARIVGLP